MATKRDYYEVLGLKKDCRGRRDQEGLSADGPEEPPRPQPRRRRGGRPVQGSRRGLRGPLRPAEAPAVRPLWPRRARRARRIHDFRNTEDIMSAFSDIFGGGLFGDLFQQRRRGPRPGQDLLMKLEIELLEAARGTVKVVDVTRQEPCTECKGSGARKGTVATTCNYCAGQGQVVQSRGFFQVATTCPACGGDGVRINDPCPTCRGVGKTPNVAHIKIDVPPGVETGMWLQLRNQGEAGDPGAPRGNLRVQIQVKKHPFFERNRNDLVLPGADQLLPGRPRRRDRGADPRRARPPGRPQGDPERRRPQAQGAGDARHQRPRPGRRAGRGPRRDAAGTSLLATRSYSASWPNSNT